MHPDLLGALARQRDQELLRPTEFQHRTAPWRPGLGARGAIRRVRSRLGEVLVDVGVHLMTIT
jgi:hypothetical protein